MNFSPMIVAMAISYGSTQMFKQILVEVFGYKPPASVVQLFAVTSSLLVTILLAVSDLGKGIEVLGQPLGNLDTASIMLIGLGGGFGAISGYSFKAAVDNTDTDKIGAASSNQTIELAPADSPIEIPSAFITAPEPEPQAPPQPVITDEVPGVVIDAPTASEAMKAA